jgi:hypothetical protein
MPRLEDLLERVGIAECLEEVSPPNGPVQGKGGLPWIHARVFASP